MVHQRLLSAMAPTIAIGLLIASPGCDDSAKPPALSETPIKTEKPEPKKPTTQEILEGPRKRIPLQLIPFSAEVPESWGVKVRGEREFSVSILEGPMIDGEARMVLGLRERVS